MLEYLRTQLKALAEQRATAFAAMGEALKTAQAENRAPNDTENTAFTEARSRVAGLDDQIATMSAQVTDLEEDEKRGAKAAEILAAAGQTGERRSGGVQVTDEPKVYGKGSKRSYFLDLARADLNRGDGDGGPSQARERLRRHSQELDVEMPRREKLRSDRAARELRSLGETSSFEREQRTNPNRTDGQGGYFVPPLWLVDEYIAFLRAGRTFANTLRSMTLPSGTDSINVPKVASGTATGIQTADAAAVTSTDLTDSTISAPVRTIAGQQDIAIQLLDQSPISFDEIVFADLLADYNQQLDLQTIYGTGSSGQVKGVTQVSSIVAVTYTDASPTGPEAYPGFAQAVSQIATARFLPPTAYFMHPRRWYWLASQLDTTNRPLVVPYAPQAYNPVAMQNGVEAEGPVGNLLGLPVFLDANIKTTLGGGTEDQVLAVRTPDVYLWEGAMRSRTLTEILSGTLQVRLQVYNYVALLADRYPKSIATIGGTGYAAPSGF